MMTKKEYISTFLEKVKEIWEPARGFLVLLRYNVLNDQQLEELFGVFKSVVSSASDDLKKRKLEKAIAALENLKNQEQEVEMLTFASELDQILAEH